MLKIKIDTLVFNITNYCNLNCTDCYTLSNLNVTGHQYWKDYEYIIAKYADLIDLKKWQLEGGEPTLNPSYQDWVLGLIRYFPDATGKIITNGSTIVPGNKKLYDLVASTNGRVSLSVSLHNINFIEEFVNNVTTSWLVPPVQTTRYPDNLEDINSFFTNWKNSYNNIKADSWPNCNSFDDWQNLPDYIKKECQEVFNFSPDKFADQLQGYKFVDSNNVTITAKKINYFENGALIFDEFPSKIKVHNSNPIIAHESCEHKLCMEVYEGKIYKCNTVGHFATLDSQFSIDVTDEDRKLFYSYIPGNSNMSIKELQAFFDNSVLPIDQCKFCPEVKTNNEIFATSKKLKFFKKEDLVNR